MKVESKVSNACDFGYVLFQSRYSSLDSNRLGHRVGEANTIFITWLLEKKAKRRRNRQNKQMQSVELRSVGSNDVTNRCPTDGAQSLATGRPPSVVEGQSAIVAQAHVTARVEDAIDAAFVADGALAAGASASRLAIETLRQRLHVRRRRAGRQNTRRKRLLHHMSGWDGLINRLSLLWPRWAHARRRLVDDGRRFGHWRRWWNGAKETDSSGAAVNIENGPQRQRNVNVHQKRGRASVSHHRHFTSVWQVEFDFVTQNGSMCHILGNDPVFRSVNVQT